MQKKGRETNLGWKIGRRLKLQQSRAPSTGVCLLHCQWGIEEETKEFHIQCFSSNKNNASFHTLTATMLQVCRRCQDYLAGGSFPTTLNKPQQHWKNDMMLWRSSKELSELWRSEGLKVLPRIPELWKELNQKMTLNWEASVILPSQVSLKHQLLQCLCQIQTFLCHVGLFTSICQIPDLMPDSDKTHATTIF